MVPERHMERGIIRAGSALKILELSLLKASDPFFGTFPLHKRHRVPITMGRDLDNFMGGTALDYPILRT